MKSKFLTAYMLLVPVLGVTGFIWHVSGGATFWWTRLRPRRTHRRICC